MKRLLLFWGLLSLACAAGLTAAAPRPETGNNRSETEEYRSLGAVDADGEAVDEASVFVGRRWRVRFCNALPHGEEFTDTAISAGHESLPFNFDTLVVAGPMTATIAAEQTRRCLEHYARSTDVAHAPDDGAALPEGCDLAVVLRGLDFRIAGRARQAGFPELNKAEHIEVSWIHISGYTAWSRDPSWSRYDPTRSATLPQHDDIEGEARITCRMTLELIAPAARRTITLKGEYRTAFGRERELTGCIARAVGHAVDDFDRLLLVR